MPKTFLVTLEDDVTTRLEGLIRAVAAARGKRIKGQEQSLQVAITKGDFEAARAQAAKVRDAARPIFPAAVLRVLVKEALKVATSEAVDVLLANDTVRRGRRDHGGSRGKVR